MLKRTERATTKSNISRLKWDFPRIDHILPSCLYWKTFKNLATVSSSLSIMKKQQPKWFILIQEYEQEWNLKENLTDNLKSRINHAERKKKEDRKSNFFLKFDPKSSRDSVVSNQSKICVSKNRIATSLQMGISKIATK